MSDPWGPTASPPPPPGGSVNERGGSVPGSRAATETRRSGAFRDSLIVAGVTALGVAGLIVWSGGDAPAGFQPDDPGSLPPSPTLPADASLPSAVTLPAGLTSPSGVTLPPGVTIPGVTAGGEQGSEGAVAAATAVTAAAVTGPSVAGVSGEEAQLALPSDPAAYEAAVNARDAMIAALPAPAGGTEQPNEPATGIRTWTFPGADWQPIRDAYLAVLQAQGYTAVVYQTTNEAGATGELYVLSDPAATVAQVAVGTQGGQSVIEVTRQ